ncbi:uncharacterized protein [Antedon mediterranea]|uniref:uncharacterized protein n=1 Tax=Antedon mediterranea TaxID=105859 RepID=UPI003AF823AC
MFTIIFNITEAVPLPDDKEFESITLMQIGIRFREDRNVLIEWCRKYGLLATEMDCPRCHVKCEEKAYARSVDLITWRCYRRECRKTINIRTGSFFAKSHLKLWQIIGLTYMWSVNCGRPTSRGLLQENMKRELEIGGDHTLVDWMKYCRNVAATFLISHPQQIGGPGNLVEIEECVIAKHKNHSGHEIPEQWLIGLYQPGTRIGMLVSVRERNAETFIPIITKWVGSGSKISSDMWTEYKELSNYGYVNANDTGVTKNRSECTWKRARNKIKAIHAPTSTDMIMADYFIQFMWYQQFKDAPFFHFWNQISTELYTFY